MCITGSAIVHDIESGHNGNFLVRSSHLRFYMYICNSHELCSLLFHMIKLVPMLVAFLAGSIRADFRAPIKNHEMQRINEVQHDIDDNIRKFKDGLEGLKTTVDFEPVTV